MKKKILVTGGMGYIGSHTSVELIAAGYEVVIIDNLSNSEVKVLDGIEKIAGVRPEFHCFDLTCEKATKDFFAQHTDLSGVIHFAAFKAVGESVENPLKYYHNNLVSLINIFANLKERPMPLVFSSSCTIYGQPEILPVTEDSPVKPAMSPYGHTKQISEEIIRDISFSNPSIKAMLLRYFNPIGAHETAVIGELPIGTPNNLVPFITQTAAGLRPQLKVFGNDYNTPDGTAVRDYIHVTDLAKAHVIALERMISSKNLTPVEVFNLGTGKGLSVLEIIQSFEKVSAQKLNYIFVPRRAGDVEKVWADTTRANEVLGWKAEKTVDDCMRTAWEWQKNII